MCYPFFFLRGSACVSWIGKVGEIKCLIHADVFQGLMHRQNVWQIIWEKFKIIYNCY
jgi:hypothetical protein